MLRPSTSSSSNRSQPAAERPLVLVVDPDRSARAVLEVALSRDGFDVWTVESAQQGLAVLGRGRTPDVIVLESELGGGDGFSFCAELRGNPKTTNVPVVLLARPEDQNVGNLAEVVGVDEYVQKPAFARDIAALVRFELIRHRSTRGAPLRFHTRVLPPAHLLRALLTSNRSGTVTLADGAASIAFREGVIVKAVFGERWGIDAIVRALSLTFAEYTVSLDPVSVTGALQCSLRDFVAQVLPRVARWNSMVLRSLPLDAVLAVDFGRLSQSLRQMPDDVNRIVRLFDGRRTVRQVLLDSTFDEVLTLEVSTRLYLMGVIGPVSETGALLRGAPRLFEPRAAEAEHLMHQLFDGLAEIRAADVEPATVTEPDWVVRPSAAADLTVDDPAGGWSTTALPDASLMEGLDEDVVRKLEAFNVPTVVEPREPTVADQPVAAFATEGATDDDATIERAVRTAMGDEGEILLGAEPSPLPIQLRAAEVEDPDPTPPSRRRAMEATPLPYRMTAPVAEPKVHDLRTLSMPQPVQDPTLEQAFFDSGEAEAIAVPSETGFEDTVAAAGSKSSGARLPLFIALAALAVIVAIGIEWLANRPIEQEPAVEAAPVLSEMLPVVTPPPSLEPVMVEEIAEPTLIDIDVSEPLADGVRAYQAGEYKKAIAVLEQVVADDPKSIQGWFVLGQARYDAGDLKGTREATAKVLELDPRHARVHLILGSVALESNDRPAARAEFEKYLELEPGGAHADEARALLKR